MAEGLAKKPVNCDACGEELDEALQCSNHECPECPWYDPPCPVCGHKMYWSRENESICQEIDCPNCPWHDPFIPPMPSVHWDTIEYKKAYGDRLWRSVDRLLWLNPGITFDEIRKTMDFRLGAFRGVDGKKSFSRSMQLRASFGIIKRYKRGWRFAKPPERKYWQAGEILEIAGIELDKA